MRLGNATYKLKDNVRIISTYSIVGPMEGKGNFGAYYDTVLDNDEWGCKTHEKCEIKMHKEALTGVIAKANLEERDIDAVMGGDLLNQIIATSYSAREFDIPYVGLYGACSTFGLSLGISSMLISGKLMDKVAICTSSHYATAERQYRYPLELGTQPTPTSQWTVTGSGAALIGNSDDINLPKITYVTIGRVKDLGITDANNMGACMAPSAEDTIIRHLTDTKREISYYDMIITGDLGKYGMDLLHYLCKIRGYDLSTVLNDTGAMIYNNNQRKCVQGGSGAGCSSVVFASYFYKEMLKGTFKRLLFVPTGALLSKDASLQGESIPAVAHAIAIEMEENDGHIS